MFWKLKMRRCPVPTQIYRSSVYLIGLCVLFVLFVPSALAQSTSTQSNDATAILAQINAVFSGGKPVRHVQFSGNATWYSGGDQDTGTVTLAVSTSGSAQMQLAMIRKGAWIETQSDIGFGMNCGWAGADGVAHTGEAMNCLKPVVWFLPSLALQPSQIPAGVGAADLGIGTVGSGSYRHLQLQAVLSEMPDRLLSESVQASTMDLGYDPQTLLARVLTYRVHPDNGAPVWISIEIRYSN